MSSYLIINILIILFPILLSFEKKVRYFEKFPPLIFAIICGAVPYIIWDIIATKRGDWNFNSAHVFNIKIYSLPLEEIMFFITVPFSSLFIYESLLAYIDDHKFQINKYIFLIVPLILFCGAIVFKSQYYTFTVLLFSGVFFLISFFSSDPLFRSGIYWLYIIITYIPFLAVNYLLTSFPIVTYNAEAIWGKRILTIPLEDFFYSFSMLSFYLLFYLTFKKKWQQIRQLR